MIRHRLNRSQFILKLAMVLIPAVAYSLAAYIRFASRLAPFMFTESGVYPYIGFVLILSMIWAATINYYQLTTVEGLFASAGKTRKVFVACLMAHLIVLGITFFYRQMSFSRLWIWVGAISTFLLTLIVRLMFRVYWTGKRDSHGRAVRLLIVGADQWAAKATRTLLAGQVMPCVVSGYVCLPGQTSAVSDAPVYQLDQIDELAKCNGIDDILIAIPPGRLADLPLLHARLSSFCVPTRVILDFGECISLQQELFNFGGFLMLDLRPTPAESIRYFFLKRIFDVCFSSLILILISPLLLFIAVAIWLTSSGPILFAQKRVGLNGNVFRMYKFRTMKVGSCNESETKWTTKHDPRCTAVGRILRHASLDELPQFFNVLNGDMSVVGPRPERPYFVEKFVQGIEEYNARHFLKAGITGWAQVNGWRGDSSIEKRVEYDLYYLRNWTLAFDLQIIVRTLLVGFMNKNAY